jgi:hypothetical protein
MSASNGKWELGVVSFFDSFEDFDQFTRLGSNYPTDGSLTTDVNESENMVLDQTIASDYTAAPFYLYTPADTSVGGAQGAELLIGPSSNSDFDGSISRTRIKSATNNYTFKVGDSDNYSVETIPYAKYQANDPVIIRTVPHGWTPEGTPEAVDFQVRPIDRYDNNYVNLHMDGGTSATIDSTSAYAYFNQKAVRLSVNNTTSNNSRRLNRLTPVNSISPHVPKYRFSCYYRLLKGNPRATTDIDTTATTADPARINLRAMSADGTFLGNLTGEATSPNVYETIMKIGSDSADYKTEFTLFTAPIGFYQTGDSAVTGEWNMMTGSSASDVKNPLKTAGLRTNRLEMQLMLSGGKNAAFDIDDLMIEHAAGTSNELNGYYEMPTWHEQGSLQWNYRQPATRNTYTVNNTLKRSKTSGNLKPKHVISASYVNVPKQMFYDMRSLLGWQDRGHLISLRPYHSGLPNVMQGVISVDNFSNQMWDLDRVSFSLKFEEA